MTDLKSKLEEEIKRRQSELLGKISFKDVYNSFQPENLFEGIKKTASGILKGAQWVGQGSMRTYAALGEAGDTAGRKILSTIYPQDKEFIESGKPDFTPQGQFQKDLYGTDKPINVRTVGAELGLNPEGNVAPIAGFAMGALDLVPGGNATKTAVVTALKNINKVDDAAKILGKLLGISKQVVTKYAPEAAKLTDEVQLGKLVDTVVKESQDVKNVVKNIISKSKALFTPKDLAQDTKFVQYTPDLINNIEKQLLGDTSKATVIDSDIIKKLHPDYDPATPSILHEESSALSKILNNKAVDQDTSGLYRMTGGGSGSGKSEITLSKLSNQPSVVFDGTLSGFESASQKIDYALSKGKQVEIHPTYTPIELATLWNKMRSRSVPLDTIIESHFGFRDTLPKLLEKYGDKIKIVPYENKSFGVRAGSLMDVTNLPEQLNTFRLSKQEARQQAELIEEWISREGIDSVKTGMNEYLSSKSLIKTEQVSKQAGETAQQTKGLTKPTPQSPSPNLRDVSSFYNLDRLNIDKGAKAAIQAEINGAGQALKETVGSTLSNKEVIDLASSTSKVVSRAVNREQTAAKIASNLRLRQEIAKVAQDGKIDESFIKLWMKDKSIGEDIARQLQARKIQADPLETGFIDTILQAIYKVNKNADEVALAARNVDFNNVKEVTEFYRKFVKPKTSEWIDLLRYNSMLTSPNTHIINTMSNLQGTGIIAPIEKTLTGILDATRSALTGQPRKYAVGEGAAYAKGFYTNLGNAARRFKDVLSGKDVVSHPDVRQIPLATKGGKRVIENVLSVPLRLLDAMDKFFMTATEAGLERAAKYRASKGIEFAGEAPVKEAARRVFRAGSENQGHVLNAVDTFTNLLMRARESDNSIVSTISKFTLPFIRTPTELLKQGIEYSPAGITTLVGAKNKTEQLSKAIMGTASAMGVAMLLGEDRLTWAEPTNAKRKAEFRAAGRQPYSVKVGDKWISYSKLHPALAFNFALVSSLDDALKNQKLSDSDADSILSAFSKYGNFLVDQSYLRNIGDFVASVKGDEERYARIASNYVQQLIPFRALSSWIERLTDPYQRQVDTDGNILDQQMQQIMMQIPGLAQKVPTRKTPLGTPLENQNRGLNAFSPNRVTTENPLFENILNINETKSKVKGMQEEIRDKILQEINRRVFK